MELPAEVSRGLCPAGSIKGWCRLKIELHLLELKSDLDGSFLSCKEIKWIQNQLVLPCAAMNTCQTCRPPLSLSTEISNASAYVITSICQGKLMLLLEGNKKYYFYNFGFFLHFFASRSVTPCPWTMHIQTEERLGTLHSCFPWVYRAAF